MKNLFSVARKSGCASSDESVGAEPGRGVAQLSGRQLDEVVGGFSLSAFGPFASSAIPSVGPLVSSSLASATPFGPLAVNTG
jgi:hypothetical protein